MKRNASIMVLALFSGAFLITDAPVSWARQRIIYKEVAPEKPLSMIEALPELNRIKPLQNPKVMKSAAVLGRSVIDRQNRTLGVVQDVVLDLDGKASALQVSFDRLRLGEPVYLSYSSTKIIPASNGYRIGLGEEEVAAMYPNLLAQIETAAGEGGSMSLSSMIGIHLLDGSDNKIGEIEDTLMNEELTKLDALYVVINTAKIHNYGIAIPYASVAFESREGVINAKLSPEDTQTLMRFIK